MLDNVIRIAGREFVSTANLAEMLKVHKRTILNWATEHRLPIISVGHMRLFDLADISDWLDKHKRQDAA